MKKYVYPFIRRALFLGMLVMLVLALNHVLTPKDYGDYPWPNTSTFREFYDLEPNTVDVLFFGSSQTVRAYSPQELYNSYGLTSYNLSSQEQSVAVSYFWLEEALRTQTPSVVILDPFYLYPYFPQTSLNMQEPHVRVAIDPMKFSLTKVRIVREICEADPSQSMLSYFLPFIRFHDRWQSLTEEDFMMHGKRGLMGYWPSFEEMGSNEFEPFGAVPGEIIEMMPAMRSYLDRMTALCKEKGIRLLLVKTPVVPWMFVGKHNAVKAYAEENGLDFIDFNEYEVFYSGFDYVFDFDSTDTEHCNHAGAVKITDYIGDFLINEYGLESHEDPQWENFNDYYQEWIDTGMENYLYTSEVF